MQSFFFLILVYVLWVQMHISGQPWALALVFQLLTAAKATGLQLPGVLLPLLRSAVSMCPASTQVVEIHSALYFRVGSALPIKQS